MNGPRIVVRSGSVGYNPFDMLVVLIDGQQTMARPVEFDSSVADKKTMYNAFGNPVKPTKLVTTCPRCGGGLQLAVDLPDPPYGMLEADCQACAVKYPKKQPFINPAKVHSLELDSLKLKVDDTIPLPTAKLDVVLDSIAESAAALEAQQLEASKPENKAKKPKPKKPKPKATVLPPPVVLQSISQPVTPQPVAEPAAQPVVPSPLSDPLALPTSDLGVGPEESFDDLDLES